MIYTTLMPHQIEALNYLKGHSPSALFHKMGYGKSLVALAYAEHIGAKRILITSDKNTIMNVWPDEIYKHTDYECAVRPKTLKYADAYCDHDGALCVCVNYDYLQGHPHITASKWDLVIMDESSEFKNQRTDRHKTLAKVVKNIPHKIMLNGEPMTERLEDLFGQFLILDGGASLSTSITSFRKRYMALSEGDYSWKPRRSSFTDVQRAIRNVSHWLMDADIKMPATNYHVVYVDMTPEQKKLDDELKEWFEAEFQGAKIEVEHAAALFVKRIQLAGGVFHSNKGELKHVTTHKLRVLFNLIRSNRQFKIVVWHQYIEETRIISASLIKLAVPHLIYTDPTDAVPLQKFQQADGGVLLIRNSMCKGLNQLADADLTIIYSNPLSYKTRAQLEGRSRRMTSVTEVNHVTDIITRGGADERVYNLLASKSSAVLTLSGLRSILDDNTS